MGDVFNPCSLALRFNHRYMTPNLWYSSLKDVPQRVLEERGIRGIILDGDNVLWEHGGTYPDTRIKDRLYELSVRYKGHICLLTNMRDEERKKEVTMNLGEVFGIPVVDGLYKKPSIRAYEAALDITGTRARETAMVDDRVGSLPGANKLGITTVLVDPLSIWSEPRIFWLARFAEKAWLGTSHLLFNHPASRYSGQ